MWKTRTILADYPGLGGGYPTGQVLATIKEDVKPGTQVKLKQFENKLLAKLDITLSTDEYDYQVPEFVYDAIYEELAERHPDPYKRLGGPSYGIAFSNDDFEIIFDILDQYVLEEAGNPTGRFGELGSKDF